ncbi:DUF3298 and DUF4163 domain-containing protein [Robertkochia solimangrovi]|uniref:DUF3298 and DUF4163 domain-containing protein n=1 Tax=Robertkochia solimangrovi TaxID=2213046 RepID=UPI0013A554EC|nr:DUF3298 and DUF4163 domain-containing protein [Robertkochia solimangrovi]
MKLKFALLSLIAGVMISCGKDNEMQFEHYTLISDNCDKCVNVDIDIPLAKSSERKARKINDQLNSHIVKLIDFSDKGDAEDIKSAIKSFEKAQSQLLSEFPEAPAKWEARIKGELSDQTNDLISIHLDSYIYSGGAHGYGSESYLNFDPGTGDLLTADDLFKSTGSFQDFAEKKFRKDHGLKTDENINSQGFMFEEDRFVLPNNIGFTRDSLFLVYNPYEIAAYSEGRIYVGFKLAEVQEFLKVNNKP